MTAKQKQQDIRGDERECSYYYGMPELGLAATQGKVKIAAINPAAINAEPINPAPVTRSMPNMAPTTNNLGLPPHMMPQMRVIDFTAAKTAHETAALHEQFRAEMAQIMANWHSIKARAVVEDDPARKPTDQRHFSSILLK